MRELCSFATIRSDQPMEAPDTQQRIDDHLAAVRARFGRFIMTWSIIVNAIWWLTDTRTMGNLPGAVSAMRWLRISVVGCSLLVLLLLRGQRVLRGGRFVICSAVWVFELGSMAFCMAMVGDLSTPWFPYLYPLIIASTVLPVDLWGRTLFASLMGLALLTGFILKRPETLHSPYFPATLSYVAFTVGLAVAFGHQLYLLTRRYYEQQLAIEEAAAIVAGQREALRHEVDLRTAELRMLAEHLDRSSEEERRSIARDLHDELGQSVSALRLSLATTLRRFAREPASIRANLDDLDELVRRIAEGTRDAITHLRPRILDDLGLGPAAEWLARTTEKHAGLTCHLNVIGDTARVGARSGVEGGDEPRAADATSTAAFRILQEALTNVVRHARAHHVEIMLHIDQDFLELRIDDDGVGLPVGASQKHGMGLVSMRERARALGGELKLESKPGEGTHITCRLPTPVRMAAA